MEIKVGDILHCHTNCVMTHSGEIATSKGRRYRVTGFRTLSRDMCLLIKDDFNHEHGFPLDNYIKYFTNTRDMLEPVKYIEKFKI